MFGRIIILLSNQALYHYSCKVINGHVNHSVQFHFVRYNTYHTYAEAMGKLSTLYYDVLKTGRWNMLSVASMAYSRPIVVKTSSKGKHKRDYTQDPVRSSLDWKLTFLRLFAAD